MVKNIQIVITDITNTGGTERTTTLLANELVRSGINVGIISLFKKNKDAAFSLDSRIDVEYLLDDVYTSQLSAFKRISYIAKCFCRLRAYCRHINAQKFIAVAFLPAFLLFLSRLSNKTIGWEHFKYSLYGNWVTRFRNFVYRRLCSVVTLTDNDTEAFKRSGVRSVTIHNIAPFAIRNNDGDSSKQLIAVGRLSYQKGYDLMLEAVRNVFKLYPDWTLNIYGNGELRHEIIQQIKSLKLEKNVFLKGCSNNIEEILQHSTIYVMSSRFEGLPMVLLEALACGIPIVSFNCKEGPSEILKNGRGLLVPAENTEMLSHSIIELIDNQQLRHSIREKGYERIKEFYPEKILPLWLNLLKS